MADVIGSGGIPVGLSVLETIRHGNWLRTLGIASLVSSAAPRNEMCRMADCLHGGQGEREESEEVAGRHGRDFWVDFAW